MNPEVAFEVMSAKTEDSIEEALDFLYQEQESIEHRINMLLDRLRRLKEKSNA